MAIIRVSFFFFSVQVKRSAAAHAEKDSLSARSSSGKESEYQVHEGAYKAERSETGVCPQDHGHVSFACRFDEYYIILRGRCQGNQKCIACNPQENKVRTERAMVVVPVGCCRNWIDLFAFKVLQRFLVLAVNIQLVGW